jgi:hypothetical protein
MKKIRNLTLIFAMVIVVIGGNVYAANIGDTISSPEITWSRYNDTNEEFEYNGLWTVEATGTGAWYNGDIHISKKHNENVTFKFRGTKLRIITQPHHSRSRNIEVKIDNIIVGNYDQNSISSIANQCLLYEITGLKNTEHIVVLTNKDSEKEFLFDAIDIDSSGELLPLPNINAPLNLTATAINSNIILNWDAVDGADSYSILRSTSSDSIDTILVSNVTNTTYTDINVKPGITYYYVVRAIKNNAISSNSNIASTKIENNVATLQIKLSTTDVYEYKMTMSDISDFIKSYTNRSNNTGLPFYIFPNNNDIEPYTKVNEYIMHDKIVWFKVKEYLR